MLESEKLLMALGTVYSSTNALSEQAEGPYKETLLDLFRLVRPPMVLVGALAVDHFVHEKRSTVDVHVAVSHEALERAIVDKLKPDYLKNPQVSAEVLNYRPFYIIGEVKNPGSYPYVGGMRAINAVAIAGGFTYRARENKLLITRAKGGSGKPEPADQHTLVLPGDVVEVPERFF